MGIDIEEAGFVEVTLKSADGASVTRRVDLQAAYNRVMCICVRVEGVEPAAQQALDYAAELVALLDEYGFPAVSHGAACAFASRVIEAVRDGVKKNASRSDGGEGATRPGSPSPTASTPTP